MKRKYKKVQDQIDDRVYHMIVTGNRCAKDHVAEIKAQADDFSMGEVKEHFARSEYSQSKQRLRRAGKIEIARNGIPVPVEELVNEQILEIGERRVNMVTGILSKAASLYHDNGHSDVAADIAEAISILNHIGEPAEVEQTESVGAAVRQ